MKKIFSTLLVIFIAFNAVAQDIGSLPGGNALPPYTPGGRLTLSSTAPVMTVDNNVATTIYYLPYVNQYVPLYNGKSWTEQALPAGISLILDTTHQPMSSVYDIYLVLNAGTPELCAEAWSSNSTVARSASNGGFGGAANSTVTQLNGIWVNNAAIATSNCYGNSIAYAIPQNQGPTSAASMPTRRAKPRWAVSPQLPPAAQVARTYICGMPTTVYHISARTGIVRQVPRTHQQPGRS